MPANPKDSASAARNRALILGILAILTGGLFVYFWRFSVDSDYAMIGLLAKRVLTTGEQFIFVPGVGYQGLLYETNLIALMFKIFGVGPRVLNFAPYLTYLLLCVVFYKAVSTWHGSRVASLATLLTILSTPRFYQHVLRTQPNYVETFLMGCSLIWGYAVLLKGYTQTSVTGTKPTNFRGLFLLLGFLSGFGLYTYGQIVYFLGAIALHLGILALRDRSTGAYKSQQILTALIRGTAALLATFSFLFVLGINRVQVGTRLVRWDSINNLFSLMIVLGALITLSALIRNFPRFRPILQQLPYAVFGFFAGLAPKLYYQLVLHGPSLTKIALNGERDDFLNRIRIFWIGCKDCLNLSGGSIVNLAGGSVALLFFIFFLLKSTSDLKSKVRATSIDPMQLSPFFLSFFTVALAFLFSAAVFNESASRYTVALTLVFSVGVAVIIDSMISNLRKSLRILGLAGLAVILVSGVSSIRRTLQKAQEPHFLESVAQNLRDKGLKYGFGYYWYAYALNFMTNEEIVIEPTLTNYIPYYQERLAQQSRVAYLHPYENITPEMTPGMSIVLYNREYRILSLEKVDRVGVFVLERKGS